MTGLVLWRINTICDQILRIIILTQYTSSAEASGGYGSVVRHHSLKQTGLLILDFSGAIMAVDMIQVGKLLEAGFTPEQITSMLSQGSTVSGKLKDGKGKKVEPIEAVDLSESVANSEKLFGGITTAKFGSWNEKLFVSNQGTGGKQMKWNALFVPLSDFEGKVIPADVVLRCQAVIEALHQHIEVLETVQDYAKGMTPIQPKYPESAHKIGDVETPK